MKNKRGFTLIELMIVVLLIGIVLMISLPAVTRIIGKQSDTEYNTQIKLTSKALDLYAARYQGILRTKKDKCIIVDYDTLKNEGLLKEKDVTCNGKIIMTPKKNSSYSYTYYLNCVDNNNNVKSSYNESHVPTTCETIN